MNFARMVVYFLYIPVREVAMEASKKTDAKKKLKSAAIKAAGTVTAAGMLFNAAVEPEDLLTSPEQKAQSASTAHVQSGSRPRSRRPSCR